jgi:hypothetical protein
MNIRSYNRSVNIVIGHSSATIGVLYGEVLRCAFPNGNVERYLFREGIIKRLEGGPKIDFLLMDSRTNYANGDGGPDIVSLVTSQLPLEKRIPLSRVVKIEPETHPTHVAEIIGEIAQREIK